MNKKGQGGGEGGGALVVFLLVIVVAAVIAFGVYTFFFKISTTIDAQAIETTNMIASCQKDLALANTDESKLTAYCGIFRSPLIVGGKKSYVNCEFLVQRSLTSFTLDEVPANVKQVCNSVKSTEMAYNKCLEFNQTNMGDTTSWSEYINGVKCNRGFSNKAFVLSTEPDATSKRYNLTLV